MQSTRLASLLLVLVFSARGAGAQQAGPLTTGVTNSAMLSSGRVAMDTRQCNTVCLTAVGAVAGAALGAGVTYIYNENKDASERSIADGPAVALMAIIGAVVGGLTGLTIGLRRD